VRRDGTEAMESGASAHGGEVPQTDDGTILDAKTIMGYRDESIARIESVLLNSLSELVDGFDGEFENQRRDEFYAKLEAAELLHVKDGHDLFDVSVWIRSVSEASEIEERATQKQMEAWAEEEADTVTKSLNTAKGLKEKMKKISESLVTTARNEHTTLRKKLKEQYFSFQAQLTELVANLEEEENKRRSLAMTNIMLKQKVMMLKMRGTRPESRASTKSGNPSAAADDDDDAGGDGDSRAALAQRNLDIVQLRARLEEQREQITKLKATNLKQGAELMTLRDEASEEVQKKEAEKLGKDSKKEATLLKLLQHSRDALDRKPYSAADIDDEGIPLPLGSLPQEISKLYKVLDEYSQKLERLQNHVMGDGGGSFAGFASEADMKKALESSAEVTALKNKMKEMQAAAEKQKEQIAQQASVIEKAKKMRRGGIGEEDDSDFEEEYVDPVTGQVVKRKSPKRALIESTAALTAICSRMAQFHASVVDDIVGIGSSSLSKIKIDNLKKGATDASGSEQLVQAVCGALEEYLAKYWSESGIKSMAEDIKTVTQHNARQVSAKFEHLSELNKIKGMINDAKSGGKYLGGLLERYAEQQRKWELRKMQIVQEREAAILKCMTSVLHVVTLNIGIKIEARDQQDIVHALRQSCIGRGNAFWPNQKSTTEIVAIDSTPPSRAQTAASGRKSTGPAFSVTRLPLHRMPDEGAYRDPSSWRSSRGADSYRLDTAGRDSLRTGGGDSDSNRPGHRSPRNAQGSPGATRASARRRGSSPTTQRELPESGSTARHMFFPPPLPPMNLP